MDDEQFVVKVINAESGKAVKTLGPANRRRAEKIEDGVNINLNHAEYYTVIEKVEPQCATN